MLPNVLNMLDAIWCMCVIVTMGEDHVCVDLQPLMSWWCILKMMHKRIWSSIGMTQRKTCPNANLFTQITPHCTALDTDLCSDKPVTNCLCCWMALMCKFNGSSPDIDNSHTHCGNLSGFACLHCLALWYCIFLLQQHPV